jgi:vacuolar-type H+-ATPase subunit H
MDERELKDMIEQMRPAQLRTLREAIERRLELWQQELAEAQSGGKKKPGRKPKNGSSSERSPYAGQ